MSDPTKNPQIPEPPPGGYVEQETNRRRFMKGGLAAAPVLMTLVSRPVLGAQCLSPSAFCSGNVSSPSAGAPVCQGTTPGFWKQPQHFSDWPLGFNPTPTTSGSGKRLSTTAATMFHSSSTGFSVGTLYNFKGKTLLEVLETTGGPPADVGRHIGAALLNALTGRNSMPSDAIVRAIWNEYASKGYYEPTAGVQWNHTQICDYLKSTQPF